jgi:hypothetical protein
LRALSCPQEAKWVGVVRPAGSLAAGCQRSLLLASRSTATSRQVVYEAERVILA